MTDNAKKATVKDVKEFFGMTLQEMKAEWVNGGLTMDERNAIMTGIGNGTYTY